MGDSGLRSGDEVVESIQPIQTDHAAIPITTKHYADIAKRHATVDLSALMPADVAEFQPAAPATGASSHARRTA
jgi:hypothetical protein